MRMLLKLIFLILVLAAGAVAYLLYTQPDRPFERAGRKIDRLIEGRESAEPVEKLEKAWKRVKSTVADGMEAVEDGVEKVGEKVKKGKEAVERGREAIEESREALEEVAE